MFSVFLDFSNRKNVVYPALYIHIMVFGGTFCIVPDSGNCPALQSGPRNVD